MPAPKDYTIRSEKGVFQLYRPTASGGEERVPYEVVSLAQFIQDKNTMCNMIADGPL